MFFEMSQVTYRMSLVQLKQLVDDMKIVWLRTNPGTNLEFRKGGQGNCSLLKCRLFAYMHAMFFTSSLSLDIRTERYCLSLELLNHLPVCECCVSMHSSW